MKARVNKAVVDDFVSHKTLAVVGVSRNTTKFGNYAYRQLKAKGYHVFPVNKNVDHIGEDPCYPDLRSLPEKVDGVLIVVPPKETETVLQEVEASGIKRVWMQQGSESESAIQFCHEHDLTEVHGECILMFTEPVKSVHKVHQVVNRLFGKLPE